MRLVLAGAALLGCLGGVPRPAAAQPVKPNILILFDTSGSMEEIGNQVYDGDGTNICPPGTGTMTRLYLLKKGIRDALAQVGIDEANFGLMSFPTQVNPTATPVCYSTANGINCNDPSCMSGDTYAGHYYISQPYANFGCTITTHAQAGLPYGYSPSWFDPGIPQSLRVDVTSAEPGTHPLPSQFDPQDANIARVYKWIDDTEDPGPVFASKLSDPELHAMGATPLGFSLFYARLYFENFIKSGADPRGACRQNLIILVTDGVETCTYGTGDIDPMTCAAPSGLEATPRLEACKLFRQDGIKTYVLTDNSPWVDPSGNDDIARLGGTSPAIRITLADSSAVRKKLVEIIANAVPATEVCNGVDDNCNNQVDEGVSNKCTGWTVVNGQASDCLDPPACTKFKHCAVEECNCKDDNCDGQTDEGLPPNKCGGPCGCPVGNELCNGIDDNCNGQVDENWPELGNACDNGLLGACKRSGTYVCKPDGSGTMCNAPPAQGTAEICNGIDDNCNGLTDEGPLPGVGDPCGSDLGACKAGKYVCMGAKGLVCQTDSKPMPEVCNGIDDNCNGLTDEGPFPETGQECTCPVPPPAMAGVGECKKGHLVCKGKDGFVCEGCGFPTPERCDGLDNDCDGQTDVGATCPVMGFACKEGQCALPCKTGEFPCPSCYRCNADGYCILEDKCCGVSCPAGQSCNAKDGRCKDLCAGVTCPGNQKCVAGVCQDCFTTGCGSGERCVGGVCKPDPCAGNKCSGDEYCDNGTCIPSCAGVTCRAGERCVAGTCHDNPCAGVPCPANSFCDPSTGKCQDDPCVVKQCAPGTRCIKTKGTCEEDPCNLIDCLHPCLTCEVTAEGIGQCVAVPAGQCHATRTTVAAGGGGGCGCAHAGGGAPPSPTALLALLLAALGARRRRR